MHANVGIFYKMRNDYKHRCKCFCRSKFCSKKAGKQGDLFAVNVLTFTTVLVLIYAGTLAVVWRK